jgi:hypothetical protein
MPSEWLANGWTCAANPETGTTTAAVIIGAVVGTIGGIALLSVAVKM